MADFFNAAINDSPTITAPAGAALTTSAGLAVKFDASGNFILAGDGDAAIGVLLSNTDDDIAAGDDLTAQIKEIGLIVAGAAIPVGSEIAVGAGGAAVVAAAGKFILGYALVDAAVGDVFPVQITKSGYKPAA